MRLLASCAVCFVVGVVVGLTGCDGGGADNGTAEGEGEGAPAGEGEGEGAAEGEGEGEGEGEIFVPLALGTITDTEQACPHGTGPLAGSTCVYLNVSCPNEDDKRVELRITAPAQNVTHKGFVLLHSGSAGAGAYSNGDDPGTEALEAQAMMQDLVDEGFTVAERQWEQGWAQADNGFASAACRGATLLHHVKETYVDDAGGAFCPVGNSGGSAEIGMAMARYDVATDVDRAILTSGPFADLANACDGDNNEAWVTQCADIRETYMSQCNSVGCQLFEAARLVVDESYSGTSGMCSNAVDLDALRADSATAPGARRHMPHPVDFVMGKEDCSGVVVNGLAYEAVLRAAGTDTEVFLLDDTVHTVQADAEGVAALFPLIRDRCAAAP